MTAGSQPAAAGQRVRVALVDDSRVARRMIRRTLSEEATIEVVFEAGDGREALDQLRRHQGAPGVDVILLDLQMPGMDGLATLDALRRAGATSRVIMLSSFTRRGAAETLQALAHGACDYVCKPSATHDNVLSAFRRELVAKVLAWARARPASPSGLAKAPRAQAGPAPSGAGSRNRPPRSSRLTALAIGASTGGPQAIASLVAALPRPFPVPVFITQHMPAGFTAAFAEHVAKSTGHVCHEAVDREPVAPGVLYVAPGGFHLTVESSDQPRIRLDRSPPRHFCRPAVDVMLESLAPIYGRGLLVIILTGMGRDGVDGARRVTAEGGTVVVQDESTSVVWGMPGAVAKAGLAAAVLPLPSIAGFVRDHIGLVR